MCHPLARREGTGAPDAREPPYGGEHDELLDGRRADVDEAAYGAAIMNDCKYGYSVDENSMALTLRSDFPHDAWWTNGHVVLSDGSEYAFPLEKTGDRQLIPLGEHIVEWMRLERMQKSDDPSAFPALIEWEVFGRDM